MSREGRERLTSIPAPINPDFARRMGMDSGLAVPVRALNYEGQLFFLGVPGLCCDDLSIGSAIGREVGTAFDRFAMIKMREEAAANDARLVVARDLHDSVAQVLAGASFRLEALRSWIKAGNDPDPEIVGMKDALRTEQRHVRELIAKLRLGGGSLQPTDIVESLAQLADDLNSQWAMSCHFSAAGTLEGPAWFVHELRQLVREAAANAARHGQARHLSINLAWDEREIRLVVADDGSGLPAPDGGVRPWSIHERVKNLGGTLSLDSTQGGVKLEIHLPREEE
jgi:signal transduction histidine kinase